MESRVYLSKEAQNETVFVLILVLMESHVYAKAGKEDNFFNPS